MSNRLATTKPLAYRPIWANRGGSQPVNNCLLNQNPIIVDNSSAPPATICNKDGSYAFIEAFEQSPGVFIWRWSSDGVTTNLIEMEYNTNTEIGFIYFFTLDGSDYDISNIILPISCNLDGQIILEALPMLASGVCGSNTIAISKAV